MLFMSKCIYVETEFEKINSFNSFIQQNILASTMCETNILASIEQNKICPLSINKIVCPLSMKINCLPSIHCLPSCMNTAQHHTIPDTVKILSCQIIPPT